MTILVTGGAGYIGSHICMELLEKDYDVIVIDNLSNSHAKTIDSIEHYTGKKIKFYEGSLLDEPLLNKIFEENNIDACIHLAGYKAAAESMRLPLDYYRNNVLATLKLLNIMEVHGCKDIIFSSTAAVYGTDCEMPVVETSPLGTCASPYAKTKLIIEEILKDINSADDSWNITIMRYFNPVGAHPSGVIGECTFVKPNNIMPYITQVATGQKDRLEIFGYDYNTIDGTGVRDYIHVVDIAEGHIKALERLHDNETLEIYNLGTGHGYSVLQLVEAFQKATGQNIPYVIKEKRAGDVAASYCNPHKAKMKLGWEAKRSIEEMCLSAWKWQQKINSL